MDYSQTIGNNEYKVHKYTYFIALYFLLAPLEDLLTGSIGTAGKYLAIIILFFGLWENHWKFKYTPTAINRCILALMLLSVIGCFWAINVTVAVEREITYLLLPGIALFIGSLKFNKKEYLLIINAAVLGGLVTVTYLFFSGAFNLSTYYRLTLTENNDPNNFAALLIVPFALCFYSISEERKAVSIGKKILAVLILTVILFTGSRGGLLALAIMAATYLWLNKAYKKLGYYIAAIIAILVFIYFILPVLPQDITSRYLDLQSVIDDMTSNKSQRGAIWQHAIQDIIPSMPLWGLGTGCAPLRMGTFYGAIKGVHNTYLNIVIEYGIFGFPIFVIMLFSLLKKEIVTHRFIEASLLVGIFVVIFFLDSYAKKYFWNVIILILIADSAFHYTNQKINAC